MAYNESISAMLKEFENLITTKTVIGEPIYVGDMIVLPVVDVSFGCGAGGGAGRSANQDHASGGIGGKMTPSALLVIKDGQARLVSVKNQETVTKVLDMIPDVVDRLKGSFTKKDEETVIEAARKQGKA